jgi:hypothetical protein
MIPSSRSDSALSMLALLGLLAGAIPLPIVSPRVLARVRGAVVHDVASRRGLSLTSEARDELCRASLVSSGGAVLSTVLFILRRSLRRLGAVGIVPPVTASLEVYSLGLLFARYMDRARTSQTVRIDDREAREIRRLVDHAVRRALSWNVPAGDETATISPSEDLRDFPTRLTDGVLLAVAALPSLLRRRLENAFDAVLADTADKEPQRAK